MSYNTEQAQIIWNVLICFYTNPYGVAGIMGNLFAESSLNPQCVTGGELKTLKDKQAYIQKVKDGKISCEEFSKDGIAFGLVQWRYWSRKEALYLYWKDGHLYDIDSLMLQLNYLHKELGTYKNVEKTIWNATSVKEASDIVMERYLKPANMSEQAKEKRAKFGQEFYDLFAKGSETIVKEKYVATTAPRVNLRIGNGKEYGVILSAKVKGTKFKWVATAENGWHAVVVPDNDEKGKRVLWISPDYSRIESGSG